VTIAGKIRKIKCRTEQLMLGMRISAKKNVIHYDALSVINLTFIDGSELTLRSYNAV